ncbi:universal stress protein [Halobacterium wangiae]|uniref:universal stress protein n=1 Tax=Halobacterium wangiae TaxID=2902623 RepID=UPI001E624420|nr:universal stress protein [Halobacterium wangiae]
MTLKNVLLAVGPGDAERIDALARTTIDIAGPAGATVTFAHVFTEEEYDQARSDLDIDSGDDVTVDTVARQHATVRGLTDRLTDESIHVDVRGRVGPHGESIVTLADDVNADLVIVGGRRRSPTGKAVFGSTAQTVLLSAPCPVMFVREDH